ncbi:hypothetical protein [Winogradskyella haliclonae]|uniref:Uncharacterized protein n=1 Tax=Winogradskyella haliclonae TaxID=2048558 RepID=A0ABQ2C032_9FLAO|nr:hypothetical protein [Winogradskyella haliclonae]GGI57824.1 hypothetical protein GCM10011444_21330 [Winogradskyella haliclonae]
MKRILTFIFAITLLNSCTTEEIVQVQNNDFVSSAFEIVVDFNAANNYEFIEPYGFNVFPSDVTLVYILWDTINGQDVWRLVPQTVIFDNGDDLVYNFDFTQDDVRFFLEGSDLDNVDDIWTQNQVFRVVVVPADNVGRVDNSDINVVMQRHGITSFPRR